jgi:hypothetical protein
MVAHGFILAHGFIHGLSCFYNAHEFIHGHIVLPSMVYNEFIQKHYKGIIMNLR